MRTWILVSLCGCLLLTGCAGPSVIIDYQPGTDFHSLDQYAFQTPVDPGTGTSSLTDERVQGAVVLFLKNKGFRQVALTEAEFIPQWHVKEEREIRREGFSYGFGYGIASGNTGVGISLSTAPPANEIIRGRLVLEMIDPATSQVIWSAESTRLLSEDIEPAAREAEIRKIVGDMLQNFPPLS